MLLTFSKDRFVDSILKGTKIHTIREDKPGRWKHGMKIHFWRGNPRNTRGRHVPYPFYQDCECKGVEWIRMDRTPLPHFVHGIVIHLGKSHRDYKILQDWEIKELAVNDGLTVDELREWFVPEHNQHFEGKIIHWTDKKYYNP